MAWNMAKTFAKLIVLLRIYRCDIVVILCRLENLTRSLDGLKQHLFVVRHLPPVTVIPAWSGVIFIYFRFPQKR
jgi:hypothetical protein